MGVLIELRFDACTPNGEEVARFRAETTALVVRLWERDARRIVLCTDSCAEPMCSRRKSGSRDHRRWMRTDNPRVERNGVLGSEDALLTLQVQRLLVEAGGQDRRKVFTRATALLTWLSEVLEEPERARLGVFLDEGSARSSPRFVDV